jgi:hypothetical protein
MLIIIKDQLLIINILKDRTDSILYISRILLFRFSPFLPGIENNLILFFNGFCPVRINRITSTNKVPVAIPVVNSAD